MRRHLPSLIRRTPVAPEPEEGPRSIVVRQPAPPPEPPWAVASRATDPNFEMRRGNVLQELGRVGEARAAYSRAAKGYAAAGLVVEARVASRLALSLVPAGRRSPGVLPVIEVPLQRAVEKSR